MALNSLLALSLASAPLCGEYAPAVGGWSGAGQDEVGALQEQSGGEAAGVTEEEAYRLMDRLTDVLREVPVPVEEALGRLAELQRVVRPWDADSGAFVSYGDHQVALALVREGRPEQALELLEESLAWRAAGVGDAADDWLLFLQTAARRELMTDLLNQTGDRAKSRRSLTDLERLLEQAHAGRFAERRDGSASDVLWRSSFIALQLRADQELTAGLTDFAARTQARMEAHALERWSDAELRGLFASAEAQADWYHVRFSTLRLLLALGRGGDALERYEAWRDAGEFELLPDTDRLRLELLGASAQLELERTGEREFAEESPFEALLAPGRVAGLAPLDRLRVRLMEVSRRIEQGDLAGADSMLGQCRSEATEAELQNFHVRRLTLGLETRRWAVGVEGGEPLPEGIIGDLRERFAALLRPLEGGATSDLGSTFLEYSSGTTILGELIELEQVLQPGPEGLRRGLDHALALQEVGGLAARLGLEPRREGRVASLQGLLSRTGGAALLFVPGLYRSRAFWIEASDVASFPLADMYSLDWARTTLLEELSSFVALGRRGDAALLRERADYLAEQLLPAALRERLASAGSVALIGPGNLGYVPFELLELEPDRPIGTALAFHYWPSAAVAQHLERRGDRLEPSLDLALLARTEAEGETPGFTLTPDDLAPLLEPFTSERRALALGDEARQSWLAGAASEARAWLLIAHGQRPEGERDSSGLRLPGPDGEALLASNSAFWEHGDIRVPPLVWLGACSAWQGPFRRGDDGATHLPSRFLQHGARSVVLPFVELRYGDLVAVVAATHAELLVGAGETPLAEALRRARVAAIASARDDLGRIAPLLVHELGAPSRGLRFATESGVGERAGWRTRWPLALAVAALGFLVGALSVAGRRPGRTRG